MFEVKSHQNEVHQLRFKRQTHTWSTLLQCLAPLFSLYAFDDFHQYREIQLHYIFSANPGLKIGQRYHKLQNRTHHFPFDVATVKVKALAN